MILQAPKPVTDVYYRTADKAMTVEVQKISLITSAEEKNFNTTDPRDPREHSRTTNSKKREVANPRTRLLSPQMVPDKKKNGFNLVSTSYHMAAPQSKTPNPAKLKDIRKQPNNFMSIIESRKDEGKSNPKSQSVLQDYNIKFEKKSSENVNNAGPHSKKKSLNSESRQTTALNKLIKGHQSKEVNEPRMEDFGKEDKEGSKINRMNDDSFGKVNTDFKNSLEIEEIPEQDPMEELLSAEVCQHFSTSLINTPRITNEAAQKEKENILAIRKSHDAGSSYYNQHIKKKSFEMTCPPKTIENPEKDKKNTKTKANYANIALASNNYKTKENRSLTPNSKEIMKFERGVKKSVQRQFVKTAEIRDEKKAVAKKK